MLHLIIIIFLLCICASFIQRTTGFGFGVFIMTVLPYLIGCPVRCSEKQRLKSPVELLI